MIVARWQIEARFGHKQKVIDMLRGWHETVGKSSGLGSDSARILSGSIGAKEALVVTEVELASLADLEAAFAKIGENPAHAKWSNDLEPFIVSGSSYWEIFRVA